VTLYSVGDLDGAMKLYKEQERICRELGNKEGLASSLINQALCLMYSNQPQDGLQIAEEALKIANDYGYLALAKKIEAILQGI